MTRSYALHESLELHEMAAFKALCLTKSKSMQLLASDPELKSLLQQDADLTTQHLQELTDHLATVQAQGVTS